MPITIEIIAADEQELKRMIASLAPIAFGEGHPMLPGPMPPAVMTLADGRVAANVHLAEDMGEATELDPSAPDTGDDAEETETVAEEAPAAKRTRGRPAGAKNKPKEDTAEGAVVAPAALDTEAAEKQRANAIRTLTIVFHRSDAGKKAVKALQTKYGVTKFSDVELEFAAALTEDAKALDEGTK